jgi:WD repeat-containing protein 6
MEINFSCVPVTALHVCRIGDQDCLLAGQGSSLRVYEREERKVLLERRIFESQVIHGISSRLALPHNEVETIIRVLLWAGSAASILLLQTKRNGGSEDGPDTLVRVTEVFTVELNDWALFGGFFERDLPNVLTAFIVTAHNEVHELVVNDKLISGDRIQSWKLVSGPGCALYAAHARSTLNGLLIAVGTVFGEVVVWSANRDEQSGLWSTNIRNVFLGHKGSIFGVYLSEDLSSDGYHRQMLATCSDDRTIRLWIVEDDVHSLPTVDTNDSNPLQLSDVTGFGKGGSDAESLAMAWGHMSRIWTVKFLPIASLRDTRSLKLVSTGEDATFRLWDVSPSQSRDKKSNHARLHNICTHNIHSGKNIWSSDLYFSERICTHYSGGADGSIVGTALKSQFNTTTRDEDICLHMPFSEISYEPMIDEGLSEKDRPASPSSLKHYVVGDDGFISATAENSRLLCGKFEEHHNQISWKHTYTINSRSSILICIDRDTGSIFFAAPGGNLFAFKKGSTEVLPSSVMVDSQTTFICIASREDKDALRNKGSSILIPFPQRGSAVLACVAITGSLTMERSFRLGLPSSFVPTSASHHMELGVLLLGSRAGGIAIFTNLGDTEPTNAKRVLTKVHGSDTITSIMILGIGNLPLLHLSEQSFFVLTTGRDDTYAVHKISPFASQKESMLQTVHKSTIPIGPNIEGAYLSKSAESEGNGQELMIFGFKSKDFVVWNETRQTEVLSVDCGGAHRSWAYTPLWDKKAKAYLGGNFIWTKAGAFNIYRKSSEDHHIAQNGGHGREIKALAVSSVRLNFDSSVFKDVCLVATGAEDTTIRLFVVRYGDDVDTRAASTSRKMTCIRVLSKHTTGIHHLEFSSCGEYLFSSGGCEELFVWRLQTDVPVIGIGVVLECMLMKTDVDADARITNFKIESYSSSISQAKSTSIEFKVMAVYSNGKVKIFRYSCEREDCKGAFTLLQQIVKGSFCLTQIHDADGRIAKDVGMLTAGTNGTINIHGHDEPGLVTRHRIHQSSIKASLLLKVRSILLMITGGDDNALGITVISSGAATFNEPTSNCRSLLIPKAHVAAVTGLVLLSRVTQDDNGELVTFGSVSNDQRVKIWRITIHAESNPDVSQKDPRMQHIEVAKVMECWTSVADAAAIELLTLIPHYRSLSSGSVAEAEPSHHEILVVGVGMEIIKIPSQALTRWAK